MKHQFHLNISAALNTTLQQSDRERCLAWLHQLLGATELQYMPMVARSHWCYFAATAATQQRLGRRIVTSCKNFDFSWVWTLCCGINMSWLPLNLIVSNPILSFLRPRRMIKDTQMNLYQLLHFDKLSSWALLFLSCFGIPLLFCWCAILRLINIDWSPTPDAITLHQPGWTQDTPAAKFLFVVVLSSRVIFLASSQLSVCCISRIYVGTFEESPRWPVDRYSSDIQHASCSFTCLPGYQTSNAGTSCVSSATALPLLKRGKLR